MDTLTLFRRRIPATISHELELRLYEAALWHSLVQAQRLGLSADVEVLMRLHVEATAARQRLDDDAAA